MSEVAETETTCGKCMGRGTRFAGTLDDGTPDYITCKQCGGTGEDDEKAKNQAGHELLVELATSVMSLTVGFTSIATALGTRIAGLEAALEKERDRRNYAYDALERRIANIESNGEAG